MLELSNELSVLQHNQEEWNPKFYSGELNVFLIKMVNVCNFSDVGRLAVC